MGDQTVTGPFPQEVTAPERPSSAAHWFIKSTPAATLEKSAVRIAILVVMVTYRALGATPRIFFTDLESGPNVSGQNNAGAFVTIYGNYFGSNPQVTVGGGQAIVETPPTPYLWYQKLVIQLGRNAATGNIVVTTGSGVSNSVPFTVRAGKIHFVASTGKDSNTGDYGHAWATLQHAVDTMAAGDITYAMNGVTQAAQSYDGSLIINGSGAARAPKALVAYPGATVQVGATGSGNCGSTAVCFEGLYNGGNFPQPSYWVFAGMHMAGQDRAIKVTGDETQVNGVPHDWRIVGNDFTCPWDAVAEDACVVFGESGNIKYLGNSMHDVATLTPDSIRQAESMGVYFTTDTNHVEVGWNTFYNIAARGGIQFHSTYAGIAGTGLNLYDISIHDNLMHDGNSDGIIIATVSPEKGPVTIYNNVIYNWGTGPMPQNGGSYSCILVDGGVNNGPDTNGTVPVTVYNNTLYNCATGTPPADAGFIPAAIVLGNYSPLLKMSLGNNIIYNTRAVPYTIDYNQLHSPKRVNLIGNNNLLFGSTARLPAAGFSAVKSDNPLFANVAAHDFHLRAGSPAIHAGAMVSALTTDADGAPRTSSPDIGAYQANTESAPRLVSGPATTAKQY